MTTIVTLLTIFITSNILGVAALVWCLNRLKNAVDYNSQCIEDASEESTRMSLNLASTKFG
jgi:hypothetical protein